MAEIYVNYGCGLSAPGTWLNFDASPRLRAERTPIVKAALALRHDLLFPANVRYGDITRGLPVATESAECLYCSHVLEHLSSDDVDRALRETFRMLRPGGTFRLVVPDLLSRAEAYVREAADCSPHASDHFMRSTLLGEEARSTSLRARVRQLLGNTAHRWMFDFAGMRARLQECGFVEIRRCSFGDATHPAFADVEDRSRFYEDGEPELAIEAKKRTA